MTQHLPDDQLVGHTLQSIYEVEERVAQGGTAWIYRAKHKKLGGRVAIKILFRAFATQENARQRFLREAQLQYQLQHPHIVRVIDFIEDRGLLGFVMEWCDGYDLNAWLKQFPKATPNEWMPLIAPVLDALSYAHSQGVIHRDLKPQNILLFPQANQSLIPKLSDFGLAKNDDLSITQSGTFLGTVGYLSPEQLQHSKSADVLSDIYSFGVMLYQICTGNLPFTGDMHSVMFRILSQEPPAPLEAPLALQAIIMRCLQKDPSQRYPSARSLLDALQEVTTFQSTAPFIYETDEPITQIDDAPDNPHEEDIVSLVHLEESDQGDFTFGEDTQDSTGDQTYIETSAGTYPLPTPTPLHTPPPSSHRTPPPTPEPLSFQKAYSAKTEPSEYIDQEDPQTEPQSLLAPLVSSLSPQTPLPSPPSLDVLSSPILQTPTTPPPQKFGSSPATPPPKEPKLPNLHDFKETIPTPLEIFPPKGLSSSGHLAAHSSPPHGTRSGIRSALRTASPSSKKKNSYNAFLWLGALLIVLLGLLYFSLPTTPRASKTQHITHRPHPPHRAPALGRTHTTPRPAPPTHQPPEPISQEPKEETWQWPPKDLYFRGSRLQKMLMLLEPHPSIRNTEFANKLMSLQHKCGFRNIPEACVKAGRRLLPFSRRPKQKHLVLVVCQFFYHACKLGHQPACPLVEKHRCTLQNLKKIQEAFLQRKNK
ncbi:MAG: protein kinase [Myxococcales bacterium]|nr:protein kinase [Myxococcales bacterium]